MDMQLVLPEQALPARLTLNPENRMSDDEYFEFCAANHPARFERTAQGEIIIVPPAGFESDYRNLEISSQLREWARRDGRGKAFGPSAEYLLPSGAAYSPDASWASNAALAKVSKDQLRKFPRLVPEFVIEVISPSDRLTTAKDKMQDWMANGVELGWLVDGDAKTVYVFRRGQEPEKRSAVATLAGEGPVEGFVLECEGIWKGLSG